MNHYVIQCIKGYALISIILILFAGYAYRINSKRTSADPLRKDIHPAAVILTILWPVVFSAWIFILILRIALYGISLSLFAIGLVVIRKPFILIWLGKLITKIGNKLLQANLLLIRVFFPQLKAQIEK
jgi:hypothetical protein